MSQENVEIVLELIPAPDVDLVPVFRNDDTWAQLAKTTAPLFHPDFECAANLFGTKKTYVGMDGFRAFWLDWLAPWATYRMEEVEQTIDCGDQVLVMVRDFGRRQGTTQEVKGRNAAVWTVRDRKIARWDAYADHAQALKSVGLEE